MRDLASIPVASSPATPADDEVLHSATHLVQVEVVVRDNRGPVQGLKESDFRLFENGEARAIGTFNVSVAAPSLTVEERQNALRANRLKPSQPPMATHSAGPSATVIFIDRSGISAEADRVARQRVAEILQVLPADEPVAVCALDVAFRVISEFSDPAENRAKAVDAVWQLHPGTSPDLRTTKLIALDAITGQLSKLPGRKNLIWVSDNFPVDGEDLSATFNAHLGRTLHALNAANVAMLPVPLEVPVRRVFPVSSDASSFPAQSTGMQFGFNPAYWAEQTGGTSAFHTDAATAVRRTFEDARVTYTLGFYPENLNGSYHDLKVVVGHRHVEVKSRRGYMAAVSDVTANRIAGEGLESRVAANSGTSAMDASMQLPYFYIGNNRASLHVSVDVVPAGITFREDRNGLHGQIEIVGIATRPDGRQAARFADVVNIDLKDQEQADAFMRTPWHYEHPLTVAVGSYIFGVEIGLGPKLVGAKTMSLNIEPWSTDSFGIGGIAFSKTAKPVETMPGVHAKALVAAGEEFIESATNRFNKSDHVYFYTEVYDPALTAAKASVLAMEYRVLDRNTGELKADTGMAGVNGYIRPGSPTVPFATTLPVTQLQPGSYRLEVRAGHVSGSDVIERAVDFDVN
jgi:VWFA-related protein